MKRQVELVGECRRQRRGSRCSGSPHDERGMGLLRRLWQSGRIDDRVVAALEVVALADRRRPHVPENGELLLKAVHAFAERRERYGASRMLAVKPARAETELDSPAAHVVDL